MGKVLEKYGHLGCNSYVCTTCSSTFLVVKCFDTKPHPTGKRFCTKKCWYAWKSKNISAWNKGLAGKGICKSNSGSFKIGEHRSPDTQFKPGTKSGANSPTWKGGITPINTSIRQSSKYKDWRKRVFERDNYTCQMCKVRGVKFHADHIKPFATHHDLRFELSNGRTLCVPCHKSTPTYLKRHDLVMA